MGSTSGLVLTEAQMAFGDSRGAVPAAPSSAIDGCVFFYRQDEAGVERSLVAPDGVAYEITRFHSTH